MKEKLAKYSIYVLVTMIIVFICVTFIFKSLHDDGRLGMYIGLIVSQIVIPSIVFKSKWYIKLITSAVLCIVPYYFTKLITRKLYALEPSNVYISDKVDFIGYAFYFLISIIIIELGLAFSPKKNQ